MRSWTLWRVRPETGGLLRAALAACVVAWCLVSPNLRAQDPVAPVPQTPVAQTPAQPSFAEWLAAFRAEASAKGISDATLDAALTNLAPDPAVVEKDRTQPELTQTLDAYIATRLTPRVLASAAVMMKLQAPLLERVRRAYGVPAGVMIAVWGLESNFGQVMGSRPVITSLATLAYDGHRQLFRTELLEALMILDQKRVRLEDLKGSWAGAMGQPQFMPSSYRKFAVDFDGDGTANIWTSVDDVFASMANYLQQAGWTAGERWGREIDVPADGWDAILARVPLRTTGCRSRKEMTESRPLSEWRALHITFLGGTPPPVSEMPASLVRGDHRAFLAYHNYDALLDYNCSNAYAVSVGLLSDIAAGVH
jgi:membrane-bound lytic murein transglycosylase B